MNAGLSTKSLIGNVALAGACRKPRQVSLPRGGPSEPAGLAYDRPAAGRRGQRETAEGIPAPRMRGTRQSSTAFLAFAGT